MYQWLKANIKRNHTLATIARVLLYSGNASFLVYRCRDYTKNKYIRWLARVIATPYGVFRYFSYRDTPGREGLAFVAIAKDETMYIEEWIDFHVKQGVSHFIIYDNDSAEKFHEVLQPYINSGLVTYHKVSGKCRQDDVYNMAVVNYGHRFKYMGFIDCDEFVFVRKPLGGGL